MEFQFIDMTTPEGSKKAEKVMYKFIDNKKAHKIAEGIKARINRRADEQFDFLINRRIQEARRHLRCGPESSFYSQSLNFGTLGLIITKDDFKKLISSIYGVIYCASETIGVLHRFVILHYDYKGGFQERELEHDLINMLKIHIPVNCGCMITRKSSSVLHLEILNVIP